jgi:hypothetical protein
MRAEIFNHAEAILGIVKDLLVLPEAPVRFLTSFQSRIRRCWLVTSLKPSFCAIFGEIF